MYYILWLSSNCQRIPSPNIPNLDTLNIVPCTLFGLVGRNHNGKRVKLNIKIYTNPRLLHCAEVSLDYSWYAPCIAHFGHFPIPSWFSFSLLGFGLHMLKPIYETVCKMHLDSNTPTEFVEIPPELFTASNSEWRGSGVFPKWQVTFQ
jgi:hypothetical protein